MDKLKLGSIGSMVQLLQSKLQKLGIYNGNITGYFDRNTENALKYFQDRFDVAITGEMNEETYDRLKPYLNGYIKYKVKGEDTIFSLAGRFQTTVDAILFRNPEINIYNLEIGSFIIIPFFYIVPTDIDYSYSILKMNINALERVYNFLELGSIGKSTMGKDIPYIKIGKGKKEICYNAAIHANEWITAPLLMKFVEDFSKAYAVNGKIYGYSAREIFDEVTIYIIPMLNPDGVDLVVGDITDTKVLEKTKRIAAEYENIPYPSGWKANINGIDLNLQFPAGWEKAKKIKFAQGFTTPAPRDFVGYGPVTAIESENIYNFTLAHNFKLILTYHSQGQVIYWKYLDYEPKNSLYIGEQFAKSSGYELESTPYSSGFAGYKDWFIQNYDRPGFTIEVGIGENPLPISQFDEIYKDNTSILVLGTRLI